MTLPSITLPYSPPHPFQVPLFLLFSVCSFQGFLRVGGFGLARWGYGRCLPPPLGNHGEGCFDAWGTAGGLCVLGAGFLCFPVFFSSLHTHPLAPFPLLGHVSLHGYLVVSFCLIFCLFLVLFLVIVLTVVVYSVRSVTHFKCRRHYLFTQSCVGFFFSFCCLSFLLFSFVSSHQHSAAVSPPPYRNGDWDYLARRLRKRYPGGRFGLSRLTKTKIKNTLALRKMTAGFQKK